MNRRATESTARGELSQRPAPLARVRINASCLKRAVLLVLVLNLACTGCTSLTSPISGVPAHRLPRQFLAQPKNNLVPVELYRLRQEPPRHYLLDEGDILGIYIEGVVGDPEEPPPVHFPEEGSDLPPAVGFPVPVREDGTISLPLVDPVQVRGITLVQAENLIRKAYTIDNQILAPGKDRIMVTLMRERTYRVIVVREDARASGFGGAGGGGGSGGVRGRTDFRGEGHVITLPAYKNDVLHALAETGGLPGVNAKNQVRIVRGTASDARRRDAFIRQYYQQGHFDPCLCPPPLPDDPASIRIPLRLPPGVAPRFRLQDVILKDGDIVYVEARETEVFYTGGLLPGGEWQLPRDYDLDVLGAMAIVGQGIASSGQGGGGYGGRLGSFGGVAPGQLFILRKTPCGGQVTISVDLNRAIQDPDARLLVQAGDILILRHKPGEELLNFSLGTFFTYGIAEALRSD